MNLSSSRLSMKLGWYLQIVIFFPFHQILDSTERALEHCLNRTSHVNVQAVEGSKTTCFDLASYLCYDKHVCHGCSSHSNYLTITSPTHQALFMISKAQVLEKHSY